MLSASPPEVGQPLPAAPSPAVSPPAAVALQADLGAAAQGRSSASRSDPQPLEPARETSPALHLFGAPVNQAAVTDGAAKDQAQDFGEALQGAAQAAARPKGEAAPPQGGQPALPDRDTRPAETPRRGENPAPHRPPHIVAAAPTAHALEVTAGEVQRF